jgi:drug/metabolite transporter (DMT)-like permease
MTWLILSILCSTSIFLLFKSFQKAGVDTFQAIAFNYITAAVFGLLISDQSIFESEVHTASWFMPTALLGLLFIILFYLMAKTAQNIGISVASVSAKLSLSIPVVILIIIDPNETLGVLKIIGLVGAIVGVILTSYKPGSTVLSRQSLLFPAIIFIGSGVIDLIFSLYADVENANDTILITALPFLTAAIIGGLVIIRGASLGRRIRRKNIFAGIILGLVNFGSIYFLVRALGTGIIQKSAIIPVNNLGVVVLSAFLAVVLYSEKHSTRNLVGLFVSIVSITLFLVS